MVIFHWWSLIPSEGSFSTGGGSLSFSTGGGLWYLCNCDILADFGVVFGSQ